MMQQPDRPRTHPSSRVALLCTLGAALLVADLQAQERGRRGQRRRPPADAPQAPPPAAAAKKPVAQWLAVVGGDVHVGNGNVLRRATVLIGDDKIAAVGHDVEVPAGAKVVDASGRVVAPGFVAVKASGMGIPARVTGAAKDALNPFDPSIKMGLAAGITSCLAMFDRGTATPGGQTAVIKLAFGDLDHMVVKEQSVYSMRVPLSPEQWSKLRELVADVKSGKKSDPATPAADPAEKPAETGGETKTEAPDAPAANANADRNKAVREVLAGEARLWVTTNERFGENELRQALEIARLLGQGVVLDDPITAWAVADEVATTGSLIVINPRGREREDPGRPEDTGSNLAAAAILAEAGVPVAVTPPGGRFGGATLGTGGILGQDLHTLALDAAFAVRGGLDNRKALRTITLDAAKCLGVETRIGSLETGKDADVLILDGDPLHYQTFVQIAIVNGKIAYEKDKESFYRHIKR